MEVVPEIISQPHDAATPFSIEDLNKQWEEFREQSKKQEKDREVNVLGQPYELDESNWNISVTLSNPVQQDILEQVKPDLIGFLRSTLKNNKLTLEWKMGKIDQTKKLYTSREKFDHLAKHYPLLEDLKEKLGLDPDY